MGCMHFQSLCINPSSRDLNPHYSILKAVFKYPVSLFFAEFHYNYYILKTIQHKVLKFLGDAKKCPVFFYNKIVHATYLIDGLSVIDSETFLQAQLYATVFTPETRFVPLPHLYATYCTSFPWFCFLFCSGNSFYKMSCS
jgi:hypothetical protein